MQLYPTITRITVLLGKGGLLLAWSAKVTTTSPGSKDLHRFVGPRGVALGMDVSGSTVGTWVLPRQIESSFQHDLLCRFFMYYSFVHNLSVNTNLYPILAL